MTEVRALPWPLQQLGSAVATLALAVAVLFALVLAAPGDPIDLVGTEATRAQLSAEFGYDRTPAQRLGAWALGAASGDLGVSRVLRPGAGVGELLAPRAATSIGTLTAATALLAGLGTTLALWTRGRRDGATATVHALSSPPSFLLAFALVTIANATTWAAMSRGLVSRPAWFALPDQDSWVRWALGVAVLAVGSGALSSVHAELEDHFARVVREPWLDAALGRGERVGGLLLRATVPVLAAVLADRAALLAGALIVVEKVLLVPGLGAALFDAAAARDYDVVCSTALLATTWVVGVRTTAALARAAVDPRLRS